MSRPATQVRTDSLPAGSVHADSSNVMLARGRRHLLDGTNALPRNLVSDQRKDDRSRQQNGPEPKPIARQQRLFLRDIDRNLKGVGVSWRRTDRRQRADHAERFPFPAFHRQRCDRGGFESDRLVAPSPVDRPCPASSAGLCFAHRADEYKTARNAARPIPAQSLHAVHPGRPGLFPQHGAQHVHLVRKEQIRAFIQLTHQHQIKTYDGEEDQKESCQRVTGRQAEGQRSPQARHRRQATGSDSKT